MSVENFGQGETYSFPTKGRGRFVPIMVKAGYVEMPEFEGKESERFGYWCESCVYYSHQDASPTGAWCSKFGFPDRGFGCCKGWTPKQSVASSRAG